MCDGQCLCMVVDAAGKKACTNLEVQLNNLLTVLFQHVSQWATSVHECNIPFFLRHVFQ